MISIKEWKQHFLSVSEVLGIYQCEYWDVIYYGDYWEIIGNKAKFKWASFRNKYNTRYKDLDILLRDIMLLDPDTINLVEQDFYWTDSSSQ